jgi:VIT1/CCC1 family predicted Fe2+/Mn2+ transporter
MNTPDDLNIKQAAADEASAGQEEAQAPLEEAAESERAEEVRSWRSWRPDLSRLAIHLQRFSSISEEPTEPIPAVVPETPVGVEETGPTRLPVLARVRLWRPAERERRLQNWQDWSQFRLWRHTRPFWGSLLMIIAGLSMLVSAAFFLPLAFLAQSLWPAILVGGLLLVMGVIQLFLPVYSVITGSIGIVLAIVSLLVAAFGGCGLGMLLGVIGSALSIAWRPVRRSRFVVTQPSQASDSL